MRQAAGFQGFPPAAFDFLRGLAASNEKPWFEANRATYEQAVKAQAAAMVVAVTAALREKALPLEGDARRSGFRIYRDVRFSKDKSPYKTNAGIVWYRQGSGKDGAGIVYFHLLPGGCFTAAGFYLPEPEVLGALRERIRVHPERFLAVVAGLAAAGLALDSAETLQRMPKGFEDLAAAPVASFLKLKSFLVRRPVSDAQAQSGDVVGQVTGMAEAALPLLRFGWAAVDEARAG